MKKISLILSSLLLLTACNGSADLGSTDLMVGINKNDIAPIEIDSREENSGDKTREVANFSLDVFEKVYNGKNTLISPLSIIYALAMTSNGAESKTLEQMEEVFGTDREGLKEYLYAYKTNLPNDKKYSLSLANSIWFKDKEELTVEEDFLQTNKDYYDAEIYKASFDEATKNDINSWVKRKTDGQIEELLDKSPSEEVIMYLINALSFDAEWESIYSDRAVREDEFTTKDGTKEIVDFMHGEEHKYIEINKAIGFTKPYADNKYSFLALLPDEAVEMADFVSSLDGETLINAIRNQSNEKVITSLPKFEFEFSDELSKTLIELGMTHAFDEDLADFTSLGHSTDGNISINRVIHKTKIQVDEKGTKAGAATAVEMTDRAALILEPKEVHLNRPFFFMIVDNEFSLPIFMGVLENPKI